MKRMTSTVKMKGTNKEQFLDRSKPSFLLLDTVFPFILILVFTIDLCLKKLETLICHGTRQWWRWLMSHFIFHYTSFRFISSRETEAFEERSVPKDELHKENWKLDRLLYKGEAKWGSFYKWRQRKGKKNKEHVFFPFQMCSFSNVWIPPQTRILRSMLLTNPLLTIA